MTRAEAAEQIAALFGDRGASFLTEAERGATVLEALADVPVEALKLVGPSPHPPAERLLSGVRDFWARTGQLRPAIAATRALLRLRVIRLGNLHGDTLIELGALGALADRAGRTKDAGIMLEEALQGLKSVGGGRDLRVAVVAANLGVHYLRVSKPVEAEAAFDLAYRIRKDTAPATAGVVAAQLAEMRLRTGKTKEAVPLLQEAYTMFRAQLGPLHKRTVSRGHVLAKVLVQLDRYLEAEPVLRDLRDHAVKSGDKERTAEATFELGLALMKVRLEEESFRTIEESVRLTRALGDPHPALPNRLSVWSRLILQRRRPQEAEGLLMEAIEAETRLYGASDPRVALRYVELAGLLIRMGRIDEAMGWLDPAVSVLRSNLGDKHPQAVAAAEMLVGLLIERIKQVWELGDTGTARALRDRARTMLSMIGYDHEHARVIDDFNL